MTESPLMHRFQHLGLFLCLMVATPVAFGQAAPQAAAPQAVPPAAAAASTPAQGSNIPTVRVRSDEVNVVFTVVDKDGRFVRDLQQNQFRILDNHLPPQKILDFRAQTDLPLYVGLLIDASNSIRDRFQFEKEGAPEFLDYIIRPKSDGAFVLAFDEKLDLTQDFTGDL